MNESQDSAISSQGHRDSAVRWLDAKFQMAEPEYLAVARAAGFQPGWHVLDAGCGTGSFLPALADQVGSTGRLTALDLAPENISTVCERVEQWGFPVPLETRTGSVTALPFDDHSFDALWCANVTLYLSDGELEKAIAEFRRVLKPGGLVAIKDVDLGVTRLNPAPYGFFWHFLEATQDIAVQVHGALRSQNLKRWLERNGFGAVRQHTTLIERWAPLLLVEHLYISGILAWSAKYALQTDLASEEIAIWEKLSSRDSVDSLVNHPNFYFCEGIILAVGYVQSQVQCLCRYRYHKIVELWADTAGWRALSVSSTPARKPPLRRTSLPVLRPKPGQRSPHPGRCAPKRARVDTTDHPRALLGRASVYAKHQPR